MEQNIPEKPGLSRGEKIESLEKMKFISPDLIPQDLVFHFLQDEDPRVKDLAVDILCRTHHPALYPFIIELLPHVQGSSKRFYINVLKRLEAKPATFVLLDSLADSDSEVRQAVAGALISFGDEAVEVASEKFKSFSREEKVKTLRAFGSIPRGGRPLFETAMGDVDFWVRKEAVMGLKHKKERSWSAIILRAFEDDSPIVRLEAVKTAPACFSLDVQEALRKMLDDPNEEVASAAQAVLSGSN